MINSLRTLTTYFTIVENEGGATKYSLCRNGDSCLNSDSLTELQEYILRNDPAHKNRPLYNFRYQNGTDNEIVWGDVEKFAGHKSLIFIISTIPGFDNSEVTMKREGFYIGIYFDNKLVACVENAASLSVGLAAEKIKRDRR